MTPLPKADTQFPGAYCLLCLAAASLANSTLTSHVQTLPTEDVSRLKGEIAGLITGKGMKAHVIEESIDLDALPEFGTKGPDIALKDFSSLRRKYDIDKLVVISIHRLGVVRSYSAYFPTSDPHGAIGGLGYMIDLASNRYEWYQPMGVTKSVDGEWDEPPKFPGVTNAYFQAVEAGRDMLLKPFSN
ncbi:hypothetical protein CCZ27_20725 [Thauera sinica]|nr:hypothetical protein CCZ27_20725 [Thauera sp. K11]